MSGIMAVDEKILRSLKSAITYLESDKKDGGLLADNLWHVAAELEYALFLLSFKIHDENCVPRMKSSLGSRKADVASGLYSIKNLLIQAETFFQSGSLQDAYKSAYVARQRALKIMDDLVKKKGW
jgi:hypothetical protein